MFKLVKSCQKVSSVRKNNKITKKNRPTSKFPESRNAFSEVRSAKLNTDVTILMPSTDYFGETALEQDITYLSTSCGSLQHHAEITQPHTFVALVQAYIVT